MFSVILLRCVTKFLEGPIGLHKSAKTYIPHRALVGLMVTLETEEEVGKGQKVTNQLRLL